MLEHAIRLYTRRQNYLFKFATFYMHILRFIVSDSHGIYYKVVKFYSLFT